MACVGLLWVGLLAGFVKPERVGIAADTINKLRGNGLRAIVSSLSEIFADPNHGSGFDPEAAAKENARIEAADRSRCRAGRGAD